MVPVRTSMHCALHTRRQSPHFTQALGAIRSRQAAHRAIGRCPHLRQHPQHQRHLRADQLQFRRHRLIELFLFGGHARTDKAARVPLLHGDVVVWGGPSRMRFHGIAPLKPGWHPATGELRINLTFRCAG